MTAIDRLAIGPGVRRWLGAPAGRWVTAAMVVLVLAAPGWLMADELEGFTLNDDDFVYIAYSRDWPTTWANLLTPCSTHIVPLYRLWTWVLVAVAGRLHELPTVFGAATYLALAATMAVTGVLVARETGRTAAALAAMAVLGVSSVVERAATWYAAAQALWAGAAIVVTLLLARAWSRREGPAWLALTALVAFAAPAVWTGGLLAGPAAVAYLWARDRTRVRRPLLALGAVGAVAFSLILVLARGKIRGTPMIWEHHGDVVLPRPIQGVLHVAQAIAETLVFANLGLDVTTTPRQAAILVLGLATLWAWSRRRPGRPPILPLEAAGATIVLGSYYLVYVFRGNLPFSSLRPVTWYSAIPQVGAVLFAAGWWAGLRPAAGTPATAETAGALTRGGALAVAASVAAMGLLQAPRVDRQFVQDAPALVPSERDSFKTPQMLRYREKYLKDALRKRQVRALGRLDHVEELARRMHVGRQTLRQEYGRKLIPGLTAKQDLADALDLLRLPPDDPATKPNLRRLHATLDDLLSPEPEFRPVWLPEDEHWPPPS
jgi:hypothetical protein